MIRRGAALMRDLDLFMLRGIAPLVRRLRSRHVITSGSTLILPPVRPGGLGDEAVVNGAIAGLRAVWPGATISVGAHVRGDVARWGAANVNEVDLSSWFARPRMHGWLSMARAATRHDRLVFIGTDVFDGAYGTPKNWLRVIQGADACGMRTRVVSFSCSTSVDSDASRALRKLPAATTLYARDERSRERAAALLGRAVESCADLAFLLQPAKSSDAEPSRRDPRHKRVARVGININPALLLEDVSYAECIEHAYELVVGVVGVVGAGGAEVVMIPHDWRGTPSDRDLAEAIVERASRDGLFVSLSGEVRAAGVKALVETLDLVVSGRMHLAVAALGVGTPVICATYQDKVEGLFERLGVRDLVIEPSMFTDPPALTELVRKTLSNGEDVRHKIKDQLPHTIELALAAVR